MSIKHSVSQWNGKSTEAINSLYCQHAAQNGFIDEIIQLCHEPNLQKACSWLVQRHLKNGHGLDTQQSDNLIELLNNPQDWESQLHLLQCLPFLTITKPQKRTAERFIRNSLEASNKFIRAWGFSGFYHLAQQYPEYRAEAERRLEEALEDEAPSVKARIRQLGGLNPAGR